MKDDDAIRIPALKGGVFHEDKLLEKITTDTVIDAMVEHKWLVAKSISIHIIGTDIWDKLSEENKGIIIKSVNETKLKTSGLM